MFSDKKRNWLSFPCHTILYKSWTEWKLHKVYSSESWKLKFFPYLWNIKNGETIQLQVLYTPMSGDYMTLDGKIDVKICVINIKEADEEDITNWLKEQVWAHMV